MALKVGPCARCGGPKNLAAGQVVSYSLGQEGWVCSHCEPQDGTSESWEDRVNVLMGLLRQAQNRLRNQGDVPEVTHRINVALHDEIERALGGSDFLMGKFYPQKEGAK